jgi:hypothetical protein
MPRRRSDESPPPVTRGEIGLLGTVAAILSSLLFLRRRKEVLAPPSGPPLPESPPPREAPLERRPVTPPPAAGAPQPELAPPPPTEPPPEALPRAGDEGRESEKVAYEPKDIDTFVITATGLALGFTTIAIVMSMWFVFNFLLNRAAKESPPAPLLQRELPTSPPQPRLEEAPDADLKAVRQREDQMLGNYAWVDQRNGVVAIPIDRALDIVSQRGLPFKTGPRAQVFPPRAGSMETGYEGRTGEPQP